MAGVLFMYANLKVWPYEYIGIASEQTSRSVDNNQKYQQPLLERSYERRQERVFLKGKRSTTKAKITPKYAASHASPLARPTSYTSVTSEGVFKLRFAAGKPSIWSFWIFRFTAVIAPA
jgi:hypothetical protein